MTPVLRFDANLKWLFTDVPFERRFESAARAGFTAVEYSSPYPYSTAFLSTCLADAGLRQILINSPVGPPGSSDRNGSACLPDRIKQFRSGLLTALDYAVALECSVIHVPAGIRPPHVSRDYAFATYVANLAWAAEQAPAGVTLVLEAINQRDAPGFLLESMEQAASVVRAVGADRLGLLFDVYHCQVSRGDLAVHLREYLPITAHVQIADVPGRAEPGSGEIAWGFIFDQIRSSGYDGWIGCEYRPAGETLDGLTWRERFAAGPAANGVS